LATVGKKEQIMSILRLLGYALTMGIVSVVAIAPSFAQTKVDPRSLEKAKFYEAPRQMQIIDDRPIVRDFREAPAAPPPPIEIPPGPASNGPGGNGAGALGGGAPSLPAGGLQMGNGSAPAYRGPSGGLGLPKSGFGGPSNIPAGGPGGKYAGLPSTTQHTMGNIVPKNAPSGGYAAPAGRSLGNTPKAPAVASYGGYGQGQGSGVGNSSRTESNVRGSLLRH
jgi:hypothetical protein